MIRFLQIILVFSLAAAPLLAQISDTASDVATPDARKTELQNWFNSLSKLEQAKLRKRLKVAKRLPKEQQKQLRDGKQTLSKQQVQGLKKLSKMSYLKRVRLHILMRELEMVKKTNRQGFDLAMKSSGSERQAALLGLVKQQRLRMYMRSMPAEKRRELDNLQPRQRHQKMREMFETESKARLNQMSSQHPRIKELRKAAESGDKQAQHDLREVMADLHTLDLLVSKLTPERKRRVMEKIKNSDTKTAADKVRKALNEQYRMMKKDRPHKEKHRQPKERKANMNPDRGNRSERRR